MIKKLLVLSVVLTLSGCGFFDRATATLTGELSEVCHDGVVYLQATSGLTVKYNSDGNIANCD